jgi:hypothetical protein
MAVALREGIMGIFANKCVKCGRKEASGEKFINIFDSYLCSDHAIEYISAKYDLSVAKKRSIIANLIDSDHKFSKPFEKGKLTSLNIFGGSWNTYAELILQLIIADTLLSIDGKLDRLISETKKDDTPSAVP